MRLTSQTLWIARPRFVLAGVGLAVLGSSCALKFTGWPADTGSATATSTGAGAASGSSSSTGAPPDCSVTVLAIDKLFLGDTDTNGTSSTNAWMLYGRNIDGQNTTTDYTMHCQPSSGANPQQAFPNGNMGTDNGFGHNILPMLQQFSQNTFSSDVNSNIATGNIGYLFDLVDLTPTNNQPSVTTRFYTGDMLAALPKFDGSDCWPVDGAQVNDPSNVTTAKVTFNGGSLGNNFWTSGPPQTLPLPLKFQGYPVILNIHEVVVQAALKGDHTATLVTGQISGVLNTEELVQAVSGFARAHNLCGAQLTPFLTQMRQASDIMTDGTQDPTKTCDGISVGLGFTAKAVLLGGVGPASAPPSMPCP